MESIARLNRSRDHIRPHLPHRNSDDSETDEYNVIGSDRQYERIGDRASGSSTGTSSRSSNNHPNIGPHPGVKATHYAESAIYRRSRGYPSPVDSEPPVIPLVPGPPQFFMNHHPTPVSLDGWKSPHSNTLEHNLKNKSHHNLIPYQNNLDNVNNVDFEPTCLMRTASGSLFIPNDGHKGLGTNPLQQSNDYNTSGTIPLKKSESKKNIDSQLPSVVPVRNHFGRPLASHLSSSRFQPLGKTLSSVSCSWRTTAISFMLLSLALLIAITFIISSALSSVGLRDGNNCAVMVDDMTEPELKTGGVGSDGKMPIPLPAKTFPPEQNKFTEVQFGKRQSHKVPSFGHWNIHLVQSDPSLVKFNLSLPLGSTVGVYASRDSVPTHTKYDFMEVIGRILGSGRQPRAASNDKLLYREFTRFLDRGNWFISIYNDAMMSTDISIVFSIADESNIPCPFDCHGKGVCVMGTCKCDADYAGDNCAYKVCPVLCSGRGQYFNGECQCSSGWKGKECQLREDECEVNDCNGHGDCVDGACHCFPGYKGKHCEDVDCLDPDCSGHGHCVAGLCLCGKGWKGADCAEPDSDAIRCLPDCSGHGNFDLTLQQCICDERYTGPDCSQERCDLDCGNNGHCQSGECLCDDGWTGAKCSERLCDPRCLEHGQCKNGSCLCIQGWNGKHCTLDGCPKSCNNHGDCVQRSGEYVCECSTDFGGLDCSVPLESVCDDGKDNDNDGLIDCADPECCSQKVCEGKQLCFSASDPQDILLRKQPPAVTASFFQRMQFLIEEESVQSYAHKVAFNDSRASVIRGQVVNHGGQGITGVRVGVATDPMLGFTLTRDTGWFDLMVNGGGAVTLHLQRDPFRPIQRVVMVPWNEIVVIDRVQLTIDERGGDTQKPGICMDHDYDQMKPTVLATWKHTFQGGCAANSALLAESRVVQESLPIPGTDLNLVYHSSRVNGYLSTIELQLTPDKIPQSLRLVHLKIAIEGILFEKTFEADPTIMFTYAWNRRNTYRQKVFGLATAMVHVGYQYTSCSNVIWDVQTVQLAGHDMSISEIGGWNLDIHHRYNFHEGILQKGDGTNVYLKQKSKVMLSTMGDGQQRPLHCPYCNGIAKDQRLLAPVALASAPDGSIYVGDFNLVRRIKTDGTVQTVIELSESSVAYKYHLAVGPIDGKLYFSDPEKHQILRAINLDQISDPRNNLEIVVGTGVKCLPGDRSACGDGRLARDARLSYPKGLAIAATGEIFVADGTNIRYVDTAGVIHTLIGDHYHKSHWKPLPCSGSIPLQKVALRWPTQLSISPIDNALHILDDHMVLKLTQDRRLRVVAGRPSHCSSVITGNQEEVANPETGESFASQVFLETPQSIAFGPNGDLYIAESDSQTINRVRVVTASDNRIQRFAGADLKCSCMDVACECFSSDLLAINAKLSTVSSIAVTPDGRLHICDQENLRIRTVLSPLPQQNAQNGEYEIVSPPENEVYVFNRHGQHVTTRSVMTGQTTYTFSYNVNTLNGKLSSVTDSAGNKLYILRDYSNQVKSIENSSGGKCRLQMSRLGMLQSFTTPDNFVTKLTYYGNTDALLATRTDSWTKSVVYHYDQYGRLTRAVRPSGDIIDMKYKLGVDGSRVSIDKNGKELMKLQIEGQDVSSVGTNDEEQTLVLQKISAKDSKIVIKSSDNSITEIESLASPVISDMWPKMAETWPLPSRMRRILNDETNIRIEWKHYVRRGSKDRQSTDKRIATVGRKLKVNGETVLAVEYDRESREETLLDKDMKPIVSVNYDSVGRPLKWTSSHNLTPVALEYDRFGRLSSWSRGQLSITMQYDNSGRLSEVRRADKSGRMYKYSDGATSPSEIIEPSGSRYLIQYDQSGGVTAIITPAGHRHEIGRQTSLGFYKLLYLMPGMKTPYILHYDDSNRIIAKLLPENSGRTVNVFNKNGLLETQFCGIEKTEFSYHDGTDLLKSVNKQFTDFTDFKVDYRYHGSLLKEERHRFGARSAFNGYKLRYKYTSGKISDVEFELNGRGVEVRKIKRNSATGAIEGVDTFEIVRRNVNSVQMIDERSMKSIGTDSYGRPVLITLSVWNKELFSQVIHYLPQRSKISESRMKFGNNYILNNYTYTLDGYIEQVSSSSNVNKYVYDIAGDVKSVWEGDTHMTIRRDESGRAKGIGDGSDLYSIDERGFVISRGQDRYIWNSNGQLLSVTKDDQRVVQYYYDHKQRLIARKESTGNVTQFIYDESQYSSRVTHCVVDGRIIGFVYDMTGHLVAITIEGTKYYVASDHLGSPIAVFNSDGIVVKEVVRNVWGKVIKDSNAGFWLPIDFNGGIRDPTTGLVHFIGGRVYDPLIGQYLSPNWDQIESLVRTPDRLHLYRFKNNDPINSDSEESEPLMTDLSLWLPSIGVNIDDVFPKKCDHTMSQTVPVISGLECQSVRLLSAFNELSIATKSGVRSDTGYKPLRQLSVASLPSTMSSVIISRGQTQTLVTSVETENNPLISSVLTSVFNSSQSLAVYLPHHSQDEFFFVQSDPSRAQPDMDQLQRLGSMVNVSRPTDNADSTSHTLMASGNLLLNVRYGVTTDEELRRVTRMVRRRAVEEAWRREQHYVRLGFRGLLKTDWTPDERQELIKTGMVSKYFGTDIHGIERFPQLADDPNNVVFRRDVQSRRRRSRSRRQRASTPYNMMSIVINQ